LTLVFPSSISGRVKLVGDCASDPPLGATLRALATERADEVLYGLGMVAVARKAEALTLVVRHVDAGEALRAAAARLGAVVEIAHAPDAWPPAVGDAVDARALVEAAERARGRAPSCYLTVAGAVREPAVLAVDEGAAVEELVAQAGGAVDDDWVAVAGGAPAGALADREATLAALGRPSLLLVLPARHEVVRRLRTPLGDWLVRAASACEGCRACSDACARLMPHAVLATLTTLRDDGVDLATALACTGCGLCDAVCPSALSPRALVVDVRDRFRAAAVAHAHTNPPANGLDVALLTQRLGLQPYDRTPVIKLRVES
jgi:ferredoxin